MPIVCCLNNGELRLKLDISIVNEGFQSHLSVNCCVRCASFAAWRSSTRND